MQNLYLDFEMSVQDKREAAQQCIGDIVECADPIRRSILEEELAQWIDEIRRETA